MRFASGTPQSTLHALHSSAMRLRSGFKGPNTLEVSNDPFQFIYKLCFKAALILSDI